MFDKLEAVEARFKEIESRLSDPQLAERPGEFRRLSQEHASLQAVVEEFQRYKRLAQEI
ncbi:MAG: PCRF domain-containing protein, partial [Bdellovibrionota bacterium]